MIWSFFENQMPHRRESNVFEFQFFFKMKKMIPQFPFCPLRHLNLPNWPNKKQINWKSSTDQSASSTVWRNEPKQKFSFIIPKEKNFRRAAAATHPVATQF